MANFGNRILDLGGKPRIILRNFSSLEAINRNSFSGQYLRHGQESFKTNVRLLSIFKVNDRIKLYTEDKRDVKKNLKTLR
jgi:hypothetical protein